MIPATMVARRPTAIWTVPMKLYVYPSSVDSEASATTVFQMGKKALERPTRTTPMESIDQDPAKMKRRPAARTSTSRAMRNFLRPWTSEAFPTMGWIDILVRSVRLSRPPRLPMGIPRLSTKGCQMTHRRLNQAPLRAEMTDRVTTLRRSSSQPSTPMPDTPRYP